MQLDTNTTIHNHLIFQLKPPLLCVPIKIQNSADADVMMRSVSCSVYLSIFEFICIYL